MLVKDAVQIAKSYVGDLFSSEHIKDIGLEEVKKDGDLWLVTIGFLRPWDEPRSVIQQIQSPLKRTYKKVFIKDASGEVVQIENWS